MGVTDYINQYWYEVVSFEPKYPDRKKRLKGGLNLFFCFLFFFFAGLLPCYLVHCRSIFNKVRKVLNDKAAQTVDEYLFQSKGNERGVFGNKPGESGQWRIAAEIEIICKPFILIFPSASGIKKQCMRVPVTRTRIWIDPVEQIFR